MTFGKLPLALAFTCVAGVAQPATFVYEFLMPEFLPWAAATAAFEGLTSTLRVHLDNGDASNFNQSYTFGDITHLQVTWIEGTPFSTALLNVADHGAFFVGSATPVITTDGIGLATLDITSTDAGQLYLDGGDDILQLAFAGPEPELGACTYFVGTPDGAGSRCAANEFFGPVTGSLAESGGAEVPLPAGAVLLTTGLLGLWGLRRRRRGASR